MLGNRNSLLHSLLFITLFSFLNLTVGCATNANISFDKIEKRPEWPIPSVILVTEIEGVTLLAGGEVMFDERRGIYDRKADLIRGITQDGDSVKIDVSDMDKVKLRKAGIDGPETSSVESHSLKRNRRWLQWKMLNGRSVKRGDIIKFDSRGAIYDAERRLIVGTTKSGRSVEISFDDIMFINNRKFSTLNSLGVVVIIGAVVAAIVFLPEYIEFHNSDGF